MRHIPVFPYRGGLVVATLVLLGVALAFLYGLLPDQPTRRTLSPGQDRTPFPWEVTLTDLQGQPVRLAHWRGQVILLNLWATWCYPCRTEMPSIQAVYQAYRQHGLTVLAIASDVQGQASVAPFVAAYGLQFPVLLDPGNALGTQLRVQGIPTTYVLDKQGRMVQVETGARDWNSPAVRRLLATLLAETAPTVTP